jgi:hypothetical protein
MRRDLRRQIRWLEHDYARTCVDRFVQPDPAVSRQRGPVLLSGEQLEQVRDELLDALAELRRDG